jgi:glyoxylase-like metal-dependent hydrolase (beta-lactamase superfamily II)
MRAEARAYRVTAVTLGVLLTVGAPAWPQPPAAPAAAPPPVRAELVTGRIFVLTGGGGANSTVLIADDGSLLVDTKSAAAAPEIAAFVAAQGGAPIRYVVNGHVHPDHTGGNEAFGASGARIVAHEGTRAVLAAGQRGGPPAPPAALPAITFPDGGGVTLFAGEERVEVRHAPPAHAADNSIVRYVDSNVLHLGDLFSPSRYQLIAGGTFQGFIDAAELALSLADDETLIVPGVGAVSRRADLVAYRDMLTTVRDRVAKLVRDGKSLEEVVAAKPTAEFDARWGSPDHMLFLPAIYAELAGRN